MSKSIVLALLTFAILVIGKPILFLFGLLKTRFRRPQISLLDASAVPDEVRSYLEHGAQPLLELGFLPLTWQRLQTFEDTEHGDLFALLLVHDAKCVRATVSVAAAGNALRATFLVDFEDGTRLETAHGESGLLIGTLPDTEVVDTPSPDVRELWQAFESRVEVCAKDKTAVRCDAAQHAQAVRDWYDRLIAAWLNDGTLQPAHEVGCFELTLKRAWHWAWRLGPAMAAHARFSLAQAKLQPLAAPLSEQIRGYQKSREMLTRRNTRWRWTSFLVVTAVLFAVSMLRFVSAREVLVLVAVVLIHELGHYTAMRVLGYRDTSIFFIPFFGAAARGVKNEERAHEQLAVLLAGPVPGIILGGALPFVFPKWVGVPTFDSFTLMLVGINLFNLLPIFPLDGGRIVQVLFGHLPPLVEVAFKALSACALLAMGFFSSDPVLMAVSIVLLVAARTAKRAADAVRRIRSLGPVPAQEHARLELVFSELVTNQPSLPPRGRYAVAQPVADRLRQAPLRIAGVAIWSGVYATCGVAGVLAIAIASSGPGVFGRPGTIASRRRPLPCDQVTALRDAGRGSYSLECSAKNAAKLAALGKTMHEFSQLPYASCLRPPWDAQVLSSAEGRSRHTVALLAAAGTQARMHELTQAMKLGSKAKTAAEATRAWRQRGHDAASAATRAEQVVASAHRDDPVFDQGIAALFMQEAAAHADGHSDDDSDEASARTSAPDRFSPQAVALIDALGRSSATCLVTSHNSGHVELKGAHVVMTGYEDAIESTVPSLARYMCSSGCELRYWTSVNDKPRVPAKLARR